MAAQERPTRRAPAPPESALMRTLKVMGARMPTVDEVSAIRALMRGNASAGQQRRAMTYMMVELCGVGSIPFAGENTHGASFRAGSMATGVAMAQIADAVLMRFPDEHSAPVHGDDENTDA